MERVFPAVPAPWIAVPSVDVQKKQAAFTFDNPVVPYTRTINYRSIRTNSVGSPRLNRTQTAHGSRTNDAGVAPIQPVNCAELRNKSHDLLQESADLYNQFLEGIRAARRNRQITEQSEFAV